MRNSKREDLSDKFDKTEMHCLVDHWQKMIEYLLILKCKRKQKTKKRTSDKKERDKYTVSDGIDNAERCRHW